MYLTPWNLDCDSWVSWSFFYKTTIIRQLTKCFVKNFMKPRVGNLNSMELYIYYICTLIYSYRHTCIYPHMHY